MPVICCGVDALVSGSSWGSSIKMMAPSLRRKQRKTPVNNHFGGGPGTPCGALLSWRPLLSHTRACTRIQGRVFCDRVTIMMCIHGLRCHRATNHTRARSAPLSRIADPPSLTPPCAVLRLLWWYRHTLPRFPPATCPRVLLTPCFIATGRGQGQAEPVAQSRSGGRDPSQEDGRGKSHVNNDSDNFNHNP